MYIGLPFLNRCLVGQKVSREIRFTGLAPIPRENRSSSVVWEPFTFQENLSLPEFIWRMVEVTWQKRK